MSLALFGHPFSSYTQKVLIALYENDTPFEFRSLGPDSPQNAAEWLRRWPLRKFPLLVDGDRSVVETSIIIEYLQLTHRGSVTLLPADPMVALEVRFLDRFFDLHVMNAAQHAVDGALTGDPVKRQDGLELAANKLDLAYAWLERQLPGRNWAAGENFSMADCAAAPSLFYADWITASARRFSAAARLSRAPDFPTFFRPRSGRCTALSSALPAGAPDRD